MENLPKTRFPPDPSYSRSNRRIDCNKVTRFSTRVDLSGSSFRDASLAKAELEGANLNNANLSFANLTKTVFINASLCHATLVSAELEDAVLRGASLKDAKLDNAKNIPPNIYPNAQAILQFGLPVPPIN